MENVHFVKGCVGMSASLFMGIGFEHTYKHVQTSAIGYVASHKLSVLETFCKWVLVFGVYWKYTHAYSTSCDAKFGVCSGGMVDQWIAIWYWHFSLALNQCQVWN